MAVNRDKLISFFFLPLQVGYEAFIWNVLLVIAKNKLSYPAPFFLPCLLGSSSLVPYLRRLLGFMFLCNRPILEALLPDGVLQFSL